MKLEQRRRRTACRWFACRPAEKDVEDGLAA
jgi:hypothetical protein